MTKLAIFDFNRTIYDPETKRLIPYAKEVLEELRERGWRLYLVSHAEGPTSGLINELGLKQFFNGVLQVLEDKSVAFKEILMREPGIPAHSIYVIGDRIRKEITQANKLGFCTVWFCSGYFAQETPSNPQETPHYTITNLQELISILP